MVEVLSAYVRQHTDPTQQRRQLPPAAVQGQTPPRPATDIQAAVTVLGRLPSHRGVSRGDLSGAHLSSAGLIRADLTDAELYKSNLSRAVLIGATLTGVWVVGADLTTAKNLTQQQLDSTRGDENTKLPARLQRPAHWPAGPATPPAADR